MSKVSTRSRVHHNVQEVRNLTEDSYVLRFERLGMDFQPGQYLSVGLKGDIHMREYSIYSPAEADYLEILVKEVEGGHVSRKLKQLKVGDELYVEGPFGFFLIDESRRKNKLYFIGTGTGISPFHSFCNSYDELDYTLLHGVRRLKEGYELDQYDPSRVVRCVSREEGGDFPGRVTDFLRANPVEPNASVYLCGNCDMIYEAYDILSEQGIPREQMFAEVYF
ncbi:ferredoxin--NADP reductase [Salinispira pacifica]|uniref:Flavohemoprotein, putative nitric oxide dioxygenase n=1 Tax=Salinispira pacifica TaxID=1307761 RepID=V5WJL9_9SPIO|nr:FAD-binding oxidoreductase [Salinispira pacifica]AHC15968.1 Flavohemoprotein, putative nitric oxide dioxygenase [Salinispira pacifica]